MTQRDDPFFQPERINEQIDELANMPEGPASHLIDSASVLDSQLVHDLHALSTTDARLLTQARLQLATMYTKNALQKSTQKNRFDPIRKRGAPMTDLPPSSSRLAKEHAPYQVTMPSRKSSGRQRVVPFLSALVAVLVIASVIAVFLFNGLQSKGSGVAHHPTPPPPLPTATTPPEVNGDYYAFVNSEVMRIDMNTKAVRWRYHVDVDGGNSADSPAFIVQGATMYVIGYDTEYAINTENGTLRFQQRYSNANANSSILVDTHHFYTTSKSTTDPSVNVYNLSDGSFIQTYHMPLNGSIMNSMIYNHVLYLTDHSSLLAWQLNTGKALWQKQLMKSGAGYWFSHMQITDNVVYIGLATDTSTLLALSADTGKQLGKITADTGVFGEFVAINHIVYYQSGTTFYARNILTNQVVWQREVSQNVTNIAAIDGQTVIYENVGPLNDLHIDITGLDARSGVQKWHHYDPQLVGPLSFIITLFDEQSGETTAGRVAFLSLRENPNDGAFTAVWLITTDGNFIRLALS